MNSNIPGTTDAPSADAATPAPATELNQSPDSAPEKAAEATGESDAPKKDEGKETDQADADKPAPEYEAFKLPEGVEMDQATLDSALPIFKELGLPQEGAQKLVEFYAKAVESFEKQGENAFNAVKTAWRDEVKSDPVIGGSNLNETMTSAGQFFDNYSRGKELRTALETTGMGDNPEFIRMAAFFGKMMSSDQGIKSSNLKKTYSSDQERRVATLYPND